MPNELVNFAFIRDEVWGGQNVRVYECKVCRAETMVPHYHREVCSGLEPITDETEVHVTPLVWLNEHLADSAVRMGHRDEQNAFYYSTVVPMSKALLQDAGIIPMPEMPLLKFAWRTRFRMWRRDMKWRIIDAWKMLRGTYSDWDDD